MLLGRVSFVPVFLFDYKLIRNHILSLCRRKAEINHIQSADKLSLFEDNKGIKIMTLLTQGCARADLIIIIIKIIIIIILTQSCADLRWLSPSPRARRSGRPRGCGGGWSGETPSWAENK